VALRDDAPLGSLRAPEQSVKRGAPAGAAATDPDSYGPETGAVVVTSRRTRVPDILLDFPIQAPASRVYDAVSTPVGLDAWWTDQSAGQPVVGAEYALRFGLEYDWRAVVTAAQPASAFELELTSAGPDWLGTRVGFDLSAAREFTQVRFHHTGWPAANEHWRISCYCWAMYLRILRRHLEYGEMVPYAQRLDV
jgi:uncharacterized protein YndB with AHSA1/START domain